MGIDVNGTIITGGTSLNVTDSSGNRLFQQDNNGITRLPANSTGATLIPLFHVGRGSTEAWTTLGTGVQPFNFTGGNGYVNIGSCYNTTNYRFTAPWTGFYLFQVCMYCYYPDGTGYSYYYHPFFIVNGSTTVRRPGGSPYRIRGYGVYGSYANDADNCELIYLTAGDYVEQYNAVGNGMQIYPPYSAWSGVYIGN